MSGGRRRRVLSGAELALWMKVAETVEPLPGRAPAPQETPKPAEKPDAAERAPETTAPPPAIAPKPAPQKPSPPSLAPIEARLRRRLARGVVAIDARIDLHGMRQEEAHRRLAGFLTGAQTLGHKVVLVITGKGRPGADGSFSGDERGVLRRSVPLWLSSPAARGVVIGFEPADPVHGGAGALYVRIRKRAAGR